MNTVIDRFYVVYQSPKYLAIAILCFFSSGLLLEILTSSILNESGILFDALLIGKNVLIYGSAAWSLLHPFIVVSETGNKWNKHIVWILLGLVPLIYILISSVSLFVGS